MNSGAIVWGSKDRVNNSVCEPFSMWREKEECHWGGSAVLLYHGNIHQANNYDALNSEPKSQLERENKRQLNHKIKKHKQKPLQKELTDLDEARRIMQKYSGRSGQNCSCVGTWLRRRDYNRVAIYAPLLSPLDLLVINDLANQDRINVNWVINDQNLFFSLSLTMVAYINIERLDDVNVIVVSSSIDIKPIESMFKQKSQAKVVRMDNIFRQLDVYENRYRLIQRLHGLQLRGIQTLILEMPRAEWVANPSEWERKLILKKHPRGEKKYLPDSIYIRKLPIYLTKSKGYVVLTDVQSEYVNIVNHVRAAVDIPVGALHNIYLFGDSTSVGFCNIDNNTIASYLQRKINEMQGHKKASYACLGLGRAGGSVAAMERRLRDIHVKPGDIVVVAGSSHYFQQQEFSKSCDENGVPHYNIQRDFDRPHDYGEMFFDRFHTTANGNRKTAEVLYERLFVHPSATIRAEALPIPVQFRHYCCGTAVTNEVQDSTSKDSSNGDINAEYEELGSDPDFLLFIHQLETYRSHSSIAGGAVMNCNPLTLGHLHLVQTAAAQVDRLFLFVVEEEKSQFAFADRLRLVRAGIAHLLNVVVLPSGKFILSSRTLPEYFEKDYNSKVKMDASMDLNIFGKWIAPALGVSVRFVGEEPLDRVTLQYNNAMRENLPKYGVELRIISRKEFGGQPISASRVRAVLREMGNGKDRNLDEIASIVPPTTLAHLQEKYTSRGQGRENMGKEEGSNS